MITESPRLLFLTQAAAVLRGMTGTRYWGGAYPNAPTVEVGEDRGFQEINQFPWLGLLPGPGAQVERDLHDGESTDRFAVLLYGYVQGDGTTPRTTWLLRLIRDCQRTLFQALTGAFAAWRPGTAYAYADDIAFGEEDLVYHTTDTGAEFLVPLTVRIPDTLAA